MPHSVVYLEPGIILSTECCRDNNQVNIGDPIEDIIISEYHTINIIHVYGENCAQTHVHESDCM